MDQLTETVREALLVVAGCRGDEQFPPFVDQTAILRAARDHGMTILASRAAQRSDWPDETKQAFRHQAIASFLHTARLEEELSAVLIALGQAGVEVLVLKGPALASTYYSDPSLRTYTDLDLLCREQEWCNVRAVLLSRGFSQLSGKEEPPPKVWNRKPLDHTQYYRVRDRVLVEIHYDLWQNGLQPRLGETYWRRAVPVVIGGSEAWTLSREDHILHLCVHLHQHSYGRLIWFTDLAMLLANHEDIDWDYLIYAARREAVELSVYYSLHHLKRLLDVSAPDRVMNALRPGAVRRRLHEYLWPADSIPRADVERRVVFELAQVPRGPALLRSILLTGRRLETSVYLLRFLFPPQAWLANYYDTHDPATLRRRRLVHAPRFLLTMIGSIGAAVLSASSLRTRSRLCRGTWVSDSCHPEVGTDPGVPTALTDRLLAR